MQAQQPTPYMIDLHLNGVTIPRSEQTSEQEVVDFSAPDLSLEQVRKATAELVTRGTTHFLATMVSAPEEVTLRNLSVIAQAMEESWGSSILGIHAEGPFFSQDTRGAHNEHDIRDRADKALFNRMFEASRGKLLLTTISPAIDGAAPFIDAIAQMGVAVSLGHHNADFRQIQEAIAAGATGITHAGNGWSKEPAMGARKNLEVVSQLADTRTYVMFIPDGIHISPEFIALWHRVVEAIKPGHSIFVSDASPLSGAEEGNYVFCNQEVRVGRDARGRSRTFPLTGSYDQLSDCVEILRGMNVVSEQEIVDGVTRNPLAFLEAPLRRIDRFPDLSGLR